MSRPPRRSRLPRTALRAWCACALALPALGQAPDTVAFVEVAAGRETYFVHQRVELTLRFGFEEQFLAESAIQPFRQELDVPAQVVAPWMAGLEGTDARALPEVEGGRTFALGDAIARARSIGPVQRGGRTFRAFEVRRAFVPLRPGGLVLDPPVLRYAYATEFAARLFEERAPVNRIDSGIDGEPLTIEVLDVPAEDRPPGFTGAVGRFEVAARLASREVGPGDTLDLELVIEGEGELGTFEAPRLLDLRGFRVLGALDELEETRRVVRYELEITGDSVDELPPIELDYFDPSGPGAYRTASTYAIPLIRVAGEPPVEERPDEESGSDDALPAGAIAGVVAALVATLVAAVRRERAAPADEPAGTPLDPRVPRAAEAYRAEGVTDDDAVPGAFVRFLAACLDCPEPAVVGGDLAERLRAVGVAAAPAAEAAALLDAIEAVRFGGSSSAGLADRAAELVPRMTEIGDAGRARGTNGADRSP